MSDKNSYLSVAERVLRMRGRPLSAQEILDYASLLEMLPSHLQGLTMHKTLQARISEEINKNQDCSKFYRTDVGQYFLRELSDDPTLSQNTISEVKSEGREKPLPSKILFVDIKGRAPCTSSSLQDVIYSNSYYDSIGSKGGERFAVGVLVTITHGDRCLLHRAGKFSNFSDSIGKQSIGFKCYIDQDDADLFSQDHTGIDTTAAKEVVRVLFGSKKQKPPSLEKIKEFLTIRTFFCDQTKNEIWVVINYQSEFLPINPKDLTRKLDLANLAWREKASLSHHQLDRLSKLILDGCLW